MITDSKMEGAPVVRFTLCRVGSHVFIWSSAGDAKLDPPDSTKCDCDSYTWALWRKEQS